VGIQGIAACGARAVPGLTVNRFCAQAPVARKPLVCQAAAAAEVVEAEAAGTKQGVAHLRFKRGSAFKVGVCGCCQSAAVACCWGNNRLVVVFHVFGSF
jgi:hypothetical protein